MRICFIPIDNRPVCYNLAKDITAIDGDIELFIPPIEFLGSLTKPADTECILKWLAEIPQCESVILSLDTLAYGGLIPSRRSTDSFEKIKSRIDALKDIIMAKKAKGYKLLDNSIVELGESVTLEQILNAADKYIMNIFQ